MLATTNHTFEIICHFEPSRLLNILNRRCTSNAIFTETSCPCKIAKNYLLKQRLLSKAYYLPRDSRQLTLLSLSSHQVTRQSSRVKEAQNCRQLTLPRVKSTVNYKIKLYLPCLHCRKAFLTVSFPNIGKLRKTS